MHDVRENNKQGRLGGGSIDATSVFSADAGNENAEQDHSNTSAPPRMAGKASLPEADHRAV